MVDIKVLSARYGLIDAGDRIPYYDQEMTRMRAAQLQQSISRELAKLLETCNYRSVYCDGSSTYLQAFPRRFLDSGGPVEVAKGRIGERLGSLKRWLVSLQAG